MFMAALSVGSFIHSLRVKFSFINVNHLGVEEVVYQDRKGNVVPWPTEAILKVNWVLSLSGDVTDGISPLSLVRASCKNKRTYQSIGKCVRNGL